MITTEITIRQGVRSVSDSGEVSWDSDVSKIGMVTSAEVEVEHTSECKLKTKELLHAVDRDRYHLSRN